MGPQGYDSLSRCSILCYLGYQNPAIPPVSPWVFPSSIYMSVEAFTIPRKNNKKSKEAQAAATRSPEMREVSQALATLALARILQEGQLGVRQGEQLRRALATAGEALGWNAAAASSKDPVADLSKDVKKLVRSGTQSLKREAANELAVKELEIEELESVSASIRELAESEDTSYPCDLSYVHTARDAARGLVTKTQTVTVNDAAEVTKVADTIDKGVPRWTQLKDLMLVELEAKQDRLGLVTQNLAEFVEFTHGLLLEVIATHH